MVQTRSASSSPVKKTTAPEKSSTKASSTTVKPSLSKPEGESLRLLISLSDISVNARFVVLSDPRDRNLRRYLFCPQRGIFELTKINTPKHDPRSVLFAEQDEEKNKEKSKDGTIACGYVNKTAEYITATPYDVCFTLLPIVADAAKSNLFQSLDDLLDPANEGIADLQYIVQNARALVEDALELMCDNVEAGDEKMFRYNQNKTLHLLLSKAKRVCQKGLPASLEERFVSRTLEAPVLCVKREETTISLSKSEKELQDSATTDISTPPESFDSQSSAASAAPSIVFSETSVTTATSITTTVPESSVSDDVKSLQRLLIAFKFIAASYLPSSLSTVFLTLLQSPTSGVDFTPLDDHLAHLAKLREEAAASMDIASFSRKRGSLEDDEEAEFRAEKKRRLEEEEKRKKANTSRGIKDLAKVDVKGMKKMSAFFTPKAPKPK